MRLVALGILGAATTAAGQTPTEGPLVVFVVNEPLRSLANRVGGDEVEVHFPAPRDVDPAHWSPDGETVARFQAADLILRNGAGYDPWIDRATLRTKTIVDTSASFRDELIANGDPVHRHGSEGVHSHAETDFTTWLDPTLAAQQARAIAAALAQRRPRAQDAFEERTQGVVTEVEELDRRVAAAAQHLAGGAVLYSHPVYGYFDRRYGLGGRSLHWEPDQDPSEDEWVALDEMLRTQPARLMLWEAKPLAATEKRLAALGIRSVVFAPCGNCGVDWLAVTRANTERLEAAVADE